jgi:drug/metabolite transporter superfamily protein YnfA
MDKTKWLTTFPWGIFLVAAVLEVAGDAAIRRGLRGGGIALVGCGVLVLGCYGIMVNLVRWDFSKLLGVYVGVFVFISILFGKFVFHETIPNSTWIGLAFIILGGLIIQFGNLL